MHYIKESNIHGKGAFAKVKFNKGNTVGLAFVKFQNTGIPDKDILRFNLGEYINHSDNPNTELVEGQVGYDSVLVYLVLAQKEINVDEELTLDYNKISWEGKKYFYK